MRCRFSGACSEAQSQTQSNTGVGLLQRQVLPFKRFTSVIPCVSPVFLCAPCGEGFLRAAPGSRKRKETEQAPVSVKVDLSKSYPANSGFGSAAAQPAGLSA